MLKMSISKLKKICSIAIIPRLLRDEVSLSTRKMGKRPLDGLWKMAKSTDSKDREAECEKCKKLIELVFGPEKPDPLIKQFESKIEDIQMDKFQKVIPPSIAVNESNTLGTQSLLSADGTKKENISNEMDKSTKEIHSIQRDDAPLNDILQYTTAKAYDEQLAQKLETIEEPGLVEAATPKIDGFNTPPKVLGGQDRILDDKKSLCTKIAPEEDAMDEIAKKCLGSPPDKIDERILEEMKSCGMLGRGRKKPSLRGNSHHAIKSNEKETIIETKSEQSTFYSKNHSSDSSRDYPPIRNHNMKFTQNQQVYPAYFKNVPLSIIGGRRLNRKRDDQNFSGQKQKEEKVVLANKQDLQEEVKTNLISPDKTTDDPYQKTPILNDEICKDISEEVSTKMNINKEETPQKIDENVEVEVEEIRVTAAETSRLGVSGESESDPDYDSKKIKPDILPCNQILQMCEKTTDGNAFKADPIEVTISSDTKDPKDLYNRSNISDRRFNSPNTAISGTFPQPQPDENATEREALSDTAISARQDPAEYYDLSHCNVEKVNNDYVLNPSTMRSLAAYHQYTIITGTDDAEDTQHLLYSTRDTRGLSLPEVENPHPIENQESPELTKKEITTSMGPLPQFKEMEEELSLSEMLRRVRERNRLEYCRAYKASEAEPAEASKCPPPLDKPGKTLGPGPCKPKPKPACPPPPPTCPPPASPCKPKDPCAKFTKACLIGDKVKETFSLVLQVVFKTDYAAPTLACVSKMNAVEPLQQILHSGDAQRVESLSSFLLSSCPETNWDRSGNEDVIYARDYEPWSPIPSWPIPKIEKKEPFVCPKEGCKINPPPRLNPPCKENPCKGLPKRSFSLVDFELEPLYLYTEY